jgi:hypothetical protein
MISYFLLMLFWALMLVSDVNEAFSPIPARSMKVPHSAVPIDCLSDIDFNFLKVGTAGALAGGFRGLSRVITFPWDTVKTLEQVKGTPGVTKAPSNLSFTDYFRGLVPTTVAAMPANAVFFIVYNYLEMFVPCILSYDVPAWARHIAFALVATLPQNVIKIPAEVVKQRAQVQDKTGTHRITIHYFNLAQHFRLTYLVLEY